MQRGRSEVAFDLRESQAMRSTIPRADGPRTSPDRRPGFWIAGVAFAGVVAGHSLAYVAAIPGAAQRDSYLARTGHSYWHNAPMAALLLEVVGLAVVAVRSFQTGLGTGMPIRLSAPRLAVRLALIQVAAFTALEVGERLVSGAGVSAMFAHHLFVVGLAVQILVAGTGALVLRWLAGAARAIGSSRRRLEESMCRPGAVFSVPDGLAVPEPSFHCDASRGRAPPHAAVLH